MRAFRDRFVADAAGADGIARAALDYVLSLA
jgi:hypothetical protein